MELFHGEKRGDIHAFSHAVVDAGADLVLGTGPHVVRSMEMYRGKLIAYSLGNFATVKQFNLLGWNGVSVVLEAELKPDGKFVRGKLIPTWQGSYGVPEVDSRGIGTDLVRWLSREDFPRSGIKIARDGAFTAR